MAPRKPFTPREYQSIMIDAMLDRPRCAVWAGMGLGKTVATLTALDILDLVEPGPALVLAPLRVAAGTWPDEAAKWEHLRHVRVSAVVGSTEQRRAALRTPATIYTTNYENLPWLVEHFGRDWPFRKIVADEATRLKSFRLRRGGMRARALAKVAHAHADRFIALTGTPAPNGLQDLWGQTWFLDRGERLGRSFEAFTTRWFWSVRLGADPHATRLEPLPTAREQIEDRLRDLALSIARARLVRPAGANRQRYPRDPAAQRTGALPGHGARDVPAARVRRRGRGVQRGEPYRQVPAARERGDLHGREVQCVFRSA